MYVNLIHRIISKNIRLCIYKEYSSSVRKSSFEYYSATRKMFVKNSNIQYDGILSENSNQTNIRIRRILFEYIITTACLNNIRLVFELVNHPKSPSPRRNKTNHVVCRS